MCPMSGLTMGVDVDMQAMCDKMPTQACTRLVARRDLIHQTLPTGFPHELHLFPFIQDHLADRTEPVVRCSPLTELSNNIGKFPQV